jgi:hypothetical protein
MHSTRWLLLFLLFSIGAPVVSSAQQLPPPPPRSSPPGFSASSTLYDLSVERPAAPSAPLSQQEIDDLAKRGITVRQDGKVLVEIIGPAGDDIRTRVDFAALGAVGVETGVTAQPSVVEEAGVEVIHIPLSVYENRAEAWLPVNRLDQVVRRLPKGYFVKEVGPVNFDAVAGEGPGVTNSDSYRDAGQNGSGLTIAVIDGGFSNLTAAATNGDAPTVYTAINYTSDTFESGGTHGTGCTEAAFDHAPGATWRLYKTNSVADLGAAVTNAIANGVDVITHSISYYNEGWADNTGTACTAANNASNNGIVFFTSAGNRAQSHYQGTWTDTVADNWHEFAVGDETVNLTIGPGSGPGGKYYLSWSDAGTDLDFYLYDPTITTVVASSTNVGAGVFEEFKFEHDSATATYHLSVYYRSGPGNPTIEIFSHNAGTWNEHIVAAGSTTSPSNTTGARVLSVAAVTHTSYGQPNGSNVVAAYSSRGPSNSGITHPPDVSGPTNTVGFTYPAPNGFGGTSSATPNAAGAATAFWSSNTQLNGYAIEWLLKEQADLYRDWGSSGYDNDNGKGGVFLTDYQFGTRWVARTYPGTGDLPTAPYYTVPGAFADVPNNGRLLVFGDQFGSYPETGTLSGKNVSVEPLEDSGSAILGQ